MKSKTRWIMALVIPVALLFMLATCVDQSMKNRLLKDAELLELSIGGIAIPLEGVLPIKSDDWDRDEFIVSSAPGYGSKIFNRPSEMTQQRIRAKVNATARPAQWGVGTLSTRPGEFFDTRVPISFESDEYIYIKVTAQDGETSSYYRFYTKLLSWATDLYSVTIVVDEEKGKSRVGKVSWGNTDPKNGPLEIATPSTFGIENYWNVAKEGPFGITTEEGQDAIIIPATFDPNATVEFASVKGDGDPTDVFKPSNVPQTFDDQDFLYVKVTAENTVDTAVYKFRVNVGRMATIENLFFVNKDTPDPTNPEAGKTIQLFGKGLPNAAWANVGPGSYVTADPPTAGYDIIIEPDDPEATYEFVLVEATTGKDVSPSFSGTPTGIMFDQKDKLAIKVTALNKNNTGQDIVMYYKIEVTLQAANFKTQPKSAWYRKGAAVTPLTFELDRPITNATYQWYAADSWYGIYGRHGMDLDEKNNVSSVNGGPSMYFYLVEPNSTDTNSRQPWAWSYTVGPQGDGTSGGDGTGTSITPRNDWNDVPIVRDGKTPTEPQWPNVNYFSGGTSEIRYYWVTVTDDDSGLSVTSDRALIITEANPTVEHFIFDMGQIPGKKNTVPFTTKNNDPYYGSDPYKIDLKEYLKGKNLDPSKYEVCVAIAQFFLPDGRPWTQNWTHGDIHFGYDDGSLTWWQNNLGANSGAIPLQTPHSSQGGLGNAPDWVGFKPSGDPAKGIPPNWPVTSNNESTEASGGLPKGTYPNTPSPPGGTAQGYFCGFIELLELRFSTTPPKEN